LATAIFAKKGCNAEYKAKYRYGLNRRMRRISRRSCGLEQRRCRKCFGRRRVQEVIRMVSRAALICIACVYISVALCSRRPALHTLVLGRHHLSPCSTFAYPRRPTPLPCHSRPTLVWLHPGRSYLLEDRADDRHPGRSGKNPRCPLQDGNGGCAGYTAPATLVCSASWDVYEQARERLVWLLGRLATRLVL